jgi:ATP-dependent Zn protease
MSDDVGMIFYGDCDSGNPYAKDSSKISEKTADLLDTEVKKLISNAYLMAIEHINKHKDWLEIIASNLLEKETLDLHEIKELLGIKD